MNIYNVLVQGVPLAFVVLGCVEWVKGLRENVEAWKRWQLRLISMGFGLFWGLGYMVLANGWPGWEFPPLFGYLAYSVGLGLVASGIYDTGKNILQRAIELLLGKLSN